MVLVYRGDNSRGQIVFHKKTIPVLRAAFAYSVRMGHFYISWVQYKTDRYSGSDLGNRKIATF